MNTEQKHTPGPWTSVSIPTSGPSAIREIQSESGLRLEFVGIHGTTKTPEVAECVSNAHLISCAPELLEALERNVKAFEEVDAETKWCEVEPNWWGKWSESVREARAVIAKARGAA